MARPTLAPVALAALFSLGACAHARPRDAGAVVRAYAAALERGDAEAVRALLSTRAQAALSREDVAKLVAAEKADLVALASAAASPDARVATRARVAWPDGEAATLVLEDGAFRVEAADALPAGAPTPEDALAELRRVLARRSFAGLLRVLAPATRVAVETELRGLVEALERPDALDVRASGDVATVRLPGGHAVTLRREAGTWHVEDFD